jgi:hypothetical protein
VVPPWRAALKLAQSSEVSAVAGLYSKACPDLTVASLLHALFALVPPGDHLHSARLAEAVCGGGVPVLLRDDAGPKWQPPFEEIVPFEIYGVIVDDDAQIGAVLNAVNRTRWLQLREAARSMCATYYHTTAAGIARTIEHFARVRAGTRGGNQGSRLAIQ